MFVLTPEAPTKVAYSVDEISTQTSLSKAYIRKKIKEGDLSAVKCGRRVLVLNEDLYKFLKRDVEN